MKRIQKIGIYAVCFCLCVACSADSPFDDWGENGTDGGTNPGGSSGSSDASGTLLDFDVSWEDIADNSYVEIAETIITDKNDDEYDDFIENSSFASSIQIAFANGSATVTGSVSGVTVTTNGAYVTVNASVAGVEYVLSGSASNGSFKVYSDKKFKLTLAGVSLTNDSGAAINIQSGKRVFVEVKTETENYLADASSYSTVTGEDEKGCFFSEGQLIFSGTGALTVTGNYKHGICSDDYVRLRSGSNITVASAVKDGIHTNDKIIIGGGILKVKASGDGLDCEKGFIDIRGGLIKADISGDASKAVKAETDITLSGGQLILLTSGSAVYEDNDLSSAAGIKCDGNLVMNGTTLLVKSTGAAGKGINCDGTLSIDNSTVKIITTGKQYVYNRLDSSAKGIKADGNLTINSGTIWVKTPGGEGSEGIESKSTLTVNGGDVSVYSYDDCMNASKSIVCPIAYVDNEPMLDGGIVDSIPLMRARSEGFTHNVVVLTRNHGYRKEAKDIHIPSFLYRKYPKVREALSRRCRVYNEQLEMVERMEAAGEITVIRPQKPVTVDRIERDIRKLTDLYEEGYACAAKYDFQ